MTVQTDLPHGGTVADGFEGVERAFLEAQAKDKGGAQLCVYRHGERVVDLWAGRDPANQRPYGEDTIAVLMSCTKGVVACAVHMLADRGLIDFDKPVSAYWPQFGEAGKDTITVRQAISHTAGLMGYDAEAGMGPSELFDHAKAVRALEVMRPLWTPGTAVMYHFVTFGILMDELIRRVDGRSASRFVADEIVKPLGINLWIGLSASEDARVAPHFNEGPQVGIDGWRRLFSAAGVDLDDRLIRAFLSTAEAADEAIARLAASPAYRAAELPAGNGIGDARALAKVYAAMIGSVGGVRLVSESAMNQARAVQTEGLAQPGELAKLGRAQPYGLGYELPFSVKPMLGPGSFGHAGAGGRLGFAHPESGVAVAYVCNTMLNNTPSAPDARWVGWTAELHRALGI